MSFVIVQILTGLSTASSLFLIACGLSIIFGVTRVVNFAHGSFYMLGAYIAYAFVSRAGGSFWAYWGGVLAAAAIVGGIGGAVELIVLRRIYRAPELFSLLATFGIVLVVEDALLAAFGPDDILGPRAPGLGGAIELLGRPFPTYDLALIAVGPIVLGLLFLLFHRTRWGTLVRAATEDREMVGALGVRQQTLFTGVFVLGTALAALGGAMQLPHQPATLDMDLRALTDAFVVVVIGGMGSIAGAFLAATLLGELQAFGIILFPQITLVLMFLIMAIVLVVRPWGLLGRPEAAARASAAALSPQLEPPSRRAAWVCGLLVLALVLVPLAGHDYFRVVVTEIVILALFAASLHFIMGPGGMVSFGHAAFFGLGAYTVAIAVLAAGLPMAAALAAAPLAAAFGAVVIGWFVVRLSGVYFAMLTLAFAQILWSGAFQWTSVTGGDNGLLGVWPSAWASGKLSFYYLSLVLCGGSVLLLRRMLFAPFGYALRAGRDSPARCEAIGIDVRRQQWLGFVAAGAFAGIAGGLYAFLKGSVFPTFMTIGISTDALLMVLLGGIHTLAGPLVGAAVFTGLEQEIGTATNYWRGILGLIILALVLVFPEGIVGYARRAFRRTPDEPRGNS
ncbi:MAG: ABC transporter permease [Alphaproteobacteria bacterium]|nr:ABC transporter permease [Alphaproteobacteria bacterium]